MRIEMSPSVYLALCALVKDALEVESDASPILSKAALELASAAATLEGLPEEVQQRGAAISAMAETANAARKTAAA